MNLALFFTRRMSLSAWARAGLLEREVAVYRRLAAAGVSVSFVTYGGPDELEYQGGLPGISILCNRWRLPRLVYEQFLPWLHGDSLRLANVFKSNQADGGQFALRAARYWGRPFVARCGYRWSSVVKKQGSWHAYWRATRIERQLFAGAERIVVTTPELARSIGQEHPGRPVVVIPNYVDTERFRPRDEVEREFDLAFVGRISEEKNVAMLLKAIRPLGVSLLIIGDGPLRADLQAQFADLADRVHWAGVVPNDHLPMLLNQARAFVLPSQFEGQPKALMEAMACGLPVIGTNVQGIRDLIRDGDTGWLCEPTVEGIRHAIQGVLSMGSASAEQAARAREFICKNFSLDRVVEVELRLLQGLAAPGIRAA